MAHQRPSFNDDASWLRYRELLWSEFSITLPEIIPEEWQDASGHQVRMDVWEPAQPPVGALIMVHGAGGNGRLLAPFAQEGAKAGWRVLAPDLPGYGLTQPSRGKRLSYEEWPLIVSEIANRQQDKVVLLGASMGGLTAVYSAENTKNLSGIIVTTLVDLSNPRIFARSARWKWLGWLSVLGMSAIPWLIDPIRIPLSIAAPLRAMSKNVRVQRYFLKDKYLGQNWLPISFWRSVLLYKREPIKLKCPLLLAHPGGDDWTPFEISLQTFEEIEARKNLVVLSNGGHLPLEQPAYAELSECVRQFLEEC